MKRGATLLQMLLVFGLAGVLGLVFNNASPLGLREPERQISFTNQGALDARSLSNLTLVTTSGSNISVDGSSITPQPPERVTANALARTNPLPSPAPLTNASTAAPPASAPASGFRNVTWPQAKAQLADGRTLLVDARLANSFQAGHIPNAISLPILSTPGDIAYFRSQHPPPATPLIIYCGSESCHLSDALATILNSQHGYTNISIMPGGFNEYLRATAENK